MAISQVSRGVFLVSPEPSKRWEDTAAGQYARIFTKARQEQWELAQKQAGLEYKTAADQYEKEMQAYRDRVKQLNDQAKANAASLAKVQEGALKADDAAKLAAVKVGVEMGKTEAGLQAKAKEQVAVAQGGTSSGTSTSTSTSTGTGFGGGGVSGRAVSEDDGQIQAAKNKAGVAPVDLANEVDTRVGVGRLSQTDPARADRTRYGTVRESVEAYKSELINQGTDAATAESHAEQVVLDELRSGGRADFAEAYGRHKGKLADVGGGAGGGTRTSESSRESVNYGSRLESKYPGLSTKFPLLSPAEQESILMQLEPEDRAGLVQQLQDRATALQEQISGEARPTLSVPDYITRSREIAAGRFGPTMPYPAYEQRNVLQGILALKPEERQQLIDQYRASLPKTPAPVAAPPVAAVAAEVPTAGMTPMQKQQADVAAARGAGILAPNPELDALLNTPVPDASGLRRPVVEPSLASRFFAERQAAGFGEQYPADIGSLALKIGRPAEVYAPEPLGEKPEGAIPPGIAFGRPRAQEFGLLGMDESTARMLANRDSPALAAAQLPPPLGTELRAPSTQSFMPPRPVMQMPVIEAAAVPTLPLRGAPPPPSIGEYTAGAVPPPVPVAGPSAAGAAPTAPMQGTPGFRTPLQGQSPESITAGTNIAIRKAQTAEADAKRKADEAAAGKAGILGATPSKSYYAERVTAAMSLKDQPDKLKRLTASGPGRVGYQIYTANKAKGIPFTTTYEEIVNTFADDKDAMKKAHDVAFASAFAAHDAVNPKE